MVHSLPLPLLLSLLSACVHDAEVGGNCEGEGDTGCVYDPAVDVTSKAVCTEGTWVRQVDEEGFALVCWPP